MGQLMVQGTVMQSKVD